MEWAKHQSTICLAKKHIASFAAWVIPEGKVLARLSPPPDIKHPHWLIDLSSQYLPRLPLPTRFFTAPHYVLLPRALNTRCFLLSDPSRTSLLITVQSLAKSPSPSGIWRLSSGPLAKIIVRIIYWAGTFKLSVYANVVGYFTRILQNMDTVHYNTNLKCTLRLDSMMVRKLTLCLDKSEPRILKWISSITKQGCSFPSWM